MTRLRRKLFAFLKLPALLALSVLACGAGQAATPAVGGSCTTGQTTFSNGQFLACNSSTWVVSSIKVGNTQAVCNNMKAGLLRLHNAKLELCTSSGWQILTSTPAP